MAKPNRFDGMMHDYCVGHGWCGGIVNGEPSHVTDYLPTSGRVSAEEFVNWLLAAEGIDETASGYNAWKKTLVPIFWKHMCSDEVDVSKLRSGWSRARG